MKGHNRIVKLAVGLLALSVIAGVNTWAGGTTEEEPTTGAVVRTGKFGEAPMLAAKVAAGELPPVADRLPKEPSVAQVLEEIGQYGGSINVFATSNDPWNTMAETTERGHYLLQLMEDGSVQGDLAKSWEMSDNGAVFTIYLREGAKWSDGEPFTTADILFAYEDLHWNNDVQTWGGVNEAKRVVAVDDYTIRYEADEPSYVMPLRLAQWLGGGWKNWQPKHYLEKWHIKYNDKANELADEEGFEGWSDALHHHFWWNPQADLDLPTMQPWIMTVSDTVRRVYERNPFYWRTDPEGNQLPYLDQIVSMIVDAEVYQLKIVAGEADLAFNGTSFANYTLYKESEGSGDYHVVTLPNVVNGGEPSFGINQNDPDPVMRRINEDVRYRRALSHAINRDEINNVVYFGLGEPRQCTVTSDALYYKEEWGEAYTEYNPQESNRLLDEMGLTQKDNDGFRLRPDGKPLQLLVEFMNVNYTEALELVKEYWEEVGLKVLLKLEEGAFFGTRSGMVDHGIMCAGCYAAGEIGNYINTAEFWRPGGSEFSWGVAWDLWLGADQEIKDGRKTLADFGGEMPGEEPPDDIKQIVQWIKERGQVPYGSKEYIEISQKIFDLHMEKLYMIGTVGLVPWVAVVKNNIGNFPSTLGGGYYHALHINWFGDQFFVKQ